MKLDEGGRKRERKREKERETEREAEGGRKLGFLV